MCMGSSLSYFFADMSKELCGRCSGGGGVGRRAEGIEIERLKYSSTRRTRMRGATNTDRNRLTT